jgi:hypothetical protein
VAEAVESGTVEHVINLCIDNNLVLNIDEYKGSSLWEDYGWSRAAYLTFSQQDLEYGDYKDGDPAKLELVNVRRNLMSEYLQRDPYPVRHIFNGGKKLKLVSDNKNSIDISTILKRRSVRSFSDQSVDFATFSSILLEATVDIREAQASQMGDSFFLLNSFYAWTVIYVYVQAVDGVKTGLYFFDVEVSSLVFVHDDIDNSKVARLIQGQSWISGGGFCLLIGAQWDRYAWIYRHSRAYINLLIQAGELSEEFILASYKRGLGGWLTPAVDENLANELCLIDEKSNVDIIHFMKFGKKK